LRFLWIFVFIFAYGLEINVDYATKDNKPYEIMNIKNDEPFECRKLERFVKCKFDKIPSTPVFKSGTIFFNIKPLFKKSFYLIIEVKTPFFLKANEDDLYNNPKIGVKIKKAKKWTIVAGKIIPYVRQKQPKGLNFFFVHSPKVYIGSIDEYGNPIKINNQTSDIIKYFAIKKAYKKGKDVLDDINEFIKDYPNSVFLPDIEFLKLKILDSENKSDEVIKLGKEWIKKFAFNENLPKVLLLIARNYTKMGFMSDASYFYQRIITEYPDTKEAYLAMIYWADQMYISGDSKKAFELYKKALYSTKDLDVASLAAMRLAQRYMDKGDIKTAFEYYQKVYKANKNFILKDKNKAFELAKTLASHQLYSLAIDIGTDLLKRLKKLDDLYEPLEYYLAVWAYDEGNYKLAKYWIDKYLTDFPYGDYSDQLNTLRDKVIFEVNDTNASAELERIDEILKKYKGDPIVKKALKKKIELLYKFKKYEELLKLLNSDEAKDIVKDKNFVKKVALEYAITLLKEKKCFKLVDVIKKYNLTLDKKYDAELYNCAMKAMDYKLASRICNKYLDSADDKTFEIWIERKIKALEGLGDYKDIVTAVDDLCRVKKECHDYELKKFFALWKLKRFKEALKTAKIIEKKADIKNADAYIKIVNYALQNNDTLLAALYAKKIIDLQNKFKTYPYSPSVEFTFAKYTKNKKEAIKVLKDLLNRVNGEDKARALYMLASLTGDKKYLDKCLKVKDSTLWKGLCKDAKSLF